MIIEHLTSLLEKDKVLVWDLDSAVEMCRLIEPIAPKYGCHVALTGGCLYKDGRRKDADILFYRIRQISVVDEVGLLENLKELGFEIIKRSGWVVKAKYEGKPLDLFFPEEQKIDVSGNCIDDQYPAGDRCPACNEERYLHIDPAYPDVEIWVHNRGQFKTCPELHKTWTESSVPARHMCSMCNQKLDFDIEESKWYHPLNKVTPKTCHRVIYGQEAGTGLINPLSGQKHCPDCSEIMYYHPYVDAWTHDKSGFIPNQIKCSRTYNIWNKWDVPDNGLCPDCNVRLLTNDVNFYHPM